MKKNLLTLCCAVALTFFIAEGVFYLWNRWKFANVSNPVTQWGHVPEQAWTEPHSVLGWVHQKNKETVLKTAHFNVNVVTNQYGFRSEREFLKNKSTKKRRILALGDSFVFAFGVEGKDGFVEVLESRKRELEVINSGVPGYGIDQMLLQFREIGQQFDPDDVVIGVFPDDFWRATRAYTDAGYGKPYFQLENGKIVLNNVPVKKPDELDFVQFPEIIRYGRIERIFQRSFIFRYLTNKTQRLARDLGWIDPDLSKEWKIGSAILKQLIQEIHTSGASAVILLIPPDRWMHHTKPTSFQKSMARFSEREQVQLIDLTAPLMGAVKKSTVSDFYIEGDGHWTEKAHRLVAYELASQLQ
jgi:hypothetical protein